MFKKEGIKYQKLRESPSPPPKVPQKNEEPQKPPELPPKLKPKEEKNLIDFSSS